VDVILHGMDLVIALLIMLLIIILVVNMFL
jgi:hypothetical protein